MGVVTPNIGIYVPAAGETNYADSFASGMINIDQHDHTGGPNKGLPITTSALGPFSVTFDKLNSNVADTLSGIGFNPLLPNQLQLLGILKNLFLLSSVPGVGFVAMNGAAVNARVFQNSATATWTNPDGVAGNPQVNFNIAGISPVPVSNGGTGVTTFNPWDIIVGGTTSTGPLQQVVGEGILNQYLGSNGASTLPSWKTFPVIPVQTLFQSTLIMTAAQFKNLKTIPIQIVPPQGIGKVIVPVSAIAKLNYTGTPFGSGSSVRFYFGPTALEATIRFDSGTFDDSYTGYYQAIGQTVTTTGIAQSSIENIGLFVSVNSDNFTGGGSNTVTITIFYNIVQI